jgi:hypothetical protein
VAVKWHSADVRVAVCRTVSFSGHYENVPTFITYHTKYCFVYSQETFALFRADIVRL